MGYDLAQNHRQFDYSVFQRSFEKRRVASCRIVSWRTGNDVKVHPGAKERSNQRVSVPLAVWFRSTQSPWLVVGSDSIEEIVPRHSLDYRSVYAIERKKKKKIKNSSLIFDFIRLGNRV